MSTALSGWIIIGGSAAIAVLLLAVGAIRAAIGAKGVRARLNSINDRTAVLRAQNAADDVARIQAAVAKAPAQVERARAALTRLDAALQTLRRVGLAVATVRSMFSGV